MNREKLIEIMDEAGITNDMEVSINITYDANSVTVVEGFSRPNHKGLIGWENNKAAYHTNGRVL